MIELQINISVHSLAVFASQSLARSYPLFPSITSQVYKQSTSVVPVVSTIIYHFCCKKCLYYR